MKKAVSIFLTMVMVFSLTACGTAESQEISDSSSTEESVVEFEQVASDGDSLDTESPESEEESKVLVAYFSWADNAILADDVDAVASPSVIPPGNVQQLAEWVQEETGGDLFSIQVTEPYPSDWDECLARANEERGNDSRPELKEAVENLEQYDTVFLGYPNWWYGVPMALLSFLEQNDLSGKQVYLFCSHGTGGLANSVELITEALPDTEISDQIFDCYEEDAASSKEEIQSWVRELGFQSGESETAGEGSWQIAVQFGENTVIYELNDGTAAASLYDQLPLTVEVEDYSTNEKIFYPAQGLDTSDSPLAQSGAGTLAYYEPWGDVVFFYDDYNENPSLFELGQAVSGADLISEMAGTITLEAAE
ncbi:MAG TPA: NAD(P)H-dependent oxidoreductase [Candidatus Limivivens merdigallinarum]|uniref:NAD(P)H-dependent oxidoreductase n=1 Tax=Candidatus Limivivens merdigallinarum TaxID=2840859 RepID=A0A9D0ZUL6_9FIRM|nr:NAD(P)H-dependent oxidoreductase [Candidatus Limivivens merdigallinarum]